MTQSEPLSLTWLISASYRQLVWSQSLRNLVRLIVTLRGLHCLLWPEKAYQIYLSCFLSELQRGMFSFPKTSCCFTSTLTSSMFLHFLPRCKVSIWDKTATHSTKFTELKRLLFFKFNFREQQPPNSNNIQTMIINDIMHTQALRQSEFQYMCMGTYIPAT